LAPVSEELFDEHLNSVAGYCGFVQCVAVLVCSFAACWSATKQATSDGANEHTRTATQWNKLKSNQQKQ
jgi:TRAP-type C4-dicarboxylate transport system permease small subunit